MSRLAHWIAQQIWWSMLWFLRRPKIKRMRVNSNRMLPKPLRDKAKRQVIQQDKFARKYGLRILTFSIMVLLTSVLLSAMGLVALRLIDEGWLTVPDQLQSK